MTDIDTTLSLDVPEESTYVSDDVFKDVLLIRKAALAEKIHDITTNIPPEDASPTASVWAFAPEDRFSLDFTDPTNFIAQKLGKGVYVAPKNDTKTLMKGLSGMQTELTEGFPTISHMTPEEKEQVMTNIARQEANWENMKPADIVIPQEEVNMWSGFVSGAKKKDFVQHKTVETLNSGEIADIVIDEFESFQIVKIRAKEKDLCAMSVVEFEKRDENTGKIVKWSASYLITLPLIEGAHFSILNKNTLKPIAKYKIRKIFLNIQHRSLIHKFFDLFV